MRSGRGAPASSGEASRSMPRRRSLACAIRAAAAAGGNRGRTRTLAPIETSFSRLARSSSGVRRCGWAGVRRSARAARRQPPDGRPEGREHGEPARGEEPDVDDEPALARERDQQRDRRDQADADPDQKSLHAGTSSPAAFAVWSSSRSAASASIASSSHPAVDVVRTELRLFEERGQLARRTGRRRRRPAGRAPGTRAAPPPSGARGPRRRARLPCARRPRSPRAVRPGSSRRSSRESPRAAIRRGARSFAEHLPRRPAADQDPGGRAETDEDDAADHCDRRPVEMRRAAADGACSRPAGFRPASAAGSRPSPGAARRRAQRRPRGTPQP